MSSQEKDAAGDHSASYNIKAVVIETGLKPPTLRAWERRYGFPKPGRSPGGHRQYTQRDIDALKWLVDKQAEGLSISHAIDLWHSLLERETDPLQTPPAPASPMPWSKVAIVTGEQVDQLRQAWISACLAFDRGTAEHLLARAFAKFSPETVCLELLQKGLVEIGRGWYQGNVTIEQEHFASALSLQRLELLVAAATPPIKAEKIVIAAAPHDHHTFSPLLLTFLLRRQGWEVIYLGANVPSAALASVVGNLKPELLIVSAQLLHTAATLRQLWQRLATSHSRLAFGGRVFNEIPRLRAHIPGFFLGELIEDALQAVPKLLAERPAAPQVKSVSETYQRALSQFQRRRALVESHVWGAYVATNKATDQLGSLNQDIARMMTAALELGDISLLGTDLHWLEYMLASFRLPSAEISDYITAYLQAARVHLADADTILLDWLSLLAGAL